MDNCHQEFYKQFWRRNRNWAFLKVSAALKAHEFRRMLRRHASHGGRLLDVGCGAGHFAASLKQMFRVSAFDSSTATIEENARRYPANVRFFAADALSDGLEAELGLYDTVTCMDVIEHVPFSRQPDLIERLACLLKPKGILVISTPDRDQSLRFKEDPNEPDEDFLRRFEGQPCADCLTAQQLDTLLDAHFRVLEASSCGPALRSRAIDLAWKSIALPVGFHGVNWLSRVIGVAHKYLVRCAMKNPAIPE